MAAYHDQLVGQRRRSDLDETLERYLICENQYIHFGTQLHWMKSPMKSDYISFILRKHLHERKPVS